MYTKVNSNDTAEPSSGATPTAFPSKADTQSRVAVVNIIESQAGEHVSGFDSDKSDCHGQTWNPQWLQSGPLLGILALVIAAGCMLVSLAVLILSDGQPIDAYVWRVQPTVYLAIASAIGAAGIRFAKAQAAPIAWWYQMLHGSSAYNMEYHWQASQGLLGALRRLLHAPLVSFATFLGVVMIIDGALLQRASSVLRVTQTRDVTLHFRLAPELPTGFSGRQKQNILSTSSISADTFVDWIHDRSIDLKVAGCDEDASCTASVLAPGIVEKNCTNQVWPISQEMLTNPNATWGPFDFGRTQEAGPNTTNALNSILLVQMWSPVATTGPELAGLGIGMANWNKSGGAYTLRTCYYRPAILEYEVEFQSGRVIPPINISQGRLRHLANNTEGFDPLEDAKEPQTMLTFVQYLSSFISANATAAINVPPYKGEMWTPNGPSFSEDASQYYNFSPSGYGVQFSDPLPDILGKFNLLMFRGGVYAARQSQAELEGKLDPGVSANQTVVGKQHWQGNVYQSDFRWFAGAAVLDAVAILVVIPLFWGFWMLPRHMSQSPLQMALAFNSPIVSNINSAASVGEALEKLGQIRLAYGFANGQAPSWQDGRLSIAKVEDVVRPRNGASVKR